MSITETKWHIFINKNKWQIAKYMYMQLLLKEKLTPRNEKPISFFKDFNLLSTDLVQTSIIQGVRKVWTHKTEDIFQYRIKKCSSPD